MKRLFKPEMIKNILIVLGIVAFVKFLWIVVSILWLPTSGIEHAKEAGVKNLYYRVDLSAKEEGQASKPSVLPAEGSITDIKLLAVYRASDMAVITVEYKGKTKVLSSGEQINGFTLEDAGSDFANLSKKGELYKIVLIKGKKSSRGTGTVTPTNADEAQNQSPEIQGEIVDTGDRKIVDRSLISHYAKNMDDIFKDIGISDIKKGEKVEGFKVGFVRRGSHFSKLGLQRGDIIKSVNGQPMNSYNAAFGIYKNIETIENMTLVIQRGDQEMELEYEVN